MLLNWGFYLTRQMTNILILAFSKPFSHKGCSCANERFWCYYEISLLSNRRRGGKVFNAML